MSRNTVREKYDITSGPSAGILVTGITGTSVRAPQRPVEFRINGIGKVRILIQGLTRENDSGVAWLIQGDLVNQKIDGTTHIQGSYNSQSRRGHIQASST